MAKQTTPKQTKPKVVIKKATVAIKPTKDSTAIFSKKIKAANANTSKLLNSDVTTRSKADLKKISQSIKSSNKSVVDLNRQKNKGKVGYDANGYPKK